jgi:rRNA maturation protein Nop10
MGPTLVLLFFFGLSAGVVGKIKGSSFLIWFVIGFFVPAIGTLAAVLYRNERFVAKRRCPECGKVLQIYDQVCNRCGADLEFPAPAPVQRQEQLS